MKTARQRSCKSVLQSPLWQCRELWRLWGWCLLRAARKHIISDCCGVPVRLGPGQAAAPLEVICAETGLSRLDLRQALTVGKEIGVLEVLCTPWGLRISIVDWQAVSLRGLCAAP
ncbi:hypothetical protein [Humidesulfovibrio mexicanus]|uniref:hypothetical protein n=1 Tax=Humidesulfovibrio mexicanus TaxID=147047 RepID=UPI001177425E|nr:hypothetical protein [Humidesulfovibrio mexicanus]